MGNVLPPPPGSLEYDRRQALLDLWFPKRSKVLKTVATRCRIEYWLAGNWHNKTGVEVYGEEAMQDLREFLKTQLVQILVPGACPTMQRHRWHGLDDTFQWLGPVSCCGGDLLHDVIPMWCNVLRTSMSPAAAFRAMERERLLAGSAPPPPDDISLGPHAEPGPAVAAAPESAVPQATEAPANAAAFWAEFNERQRGDSLRFSQSQPTPNMIILKRCLAPVLRALDHDMYVSGNRFDKENCKRLWQGDFTKCRLVESAVGEHSRQTLQDIRRNLLDQSSWETLLRGDWWTRQNAAIAFRITSTLGAAFTGLVVHAEESMPVPLFLLLSNEDKWDVVESYPPCMWDSLAEWFLSAYPDRAAATGTEAKMVLKAKALAFRSDIGRQERTHAVLRRAINAVSNTPERVVLPHVAQYMLFRRWRDIACGQFSTLSGKVALRPSGEEESAAAETLPKKIDGNRGGPWRASSASNACCLNTQASQHRKSLLRCGGCIGSWTKQS